MGDGYKGNSRVDGTDTTRARRVRARRGRAPAERRHTRRATLSERDPSASTRPGREAFSGRPARAPVTGLFKGHPEASAQ